MTDGGGSTEERPAGDGEGALGWPGPPVTGSGLGWPGDLGPPPVAA